MRQGGGRRTGCMGGEGRAVWGERDGLCGRGERRAVWKGEGDWLCGRGEGRAVWEERDVLRGRRGTCSMGGERDWLCGRGGKRYWLPISGERDVTGGQNRNLGLRTWPICFVGLNVGRTNRSRPTRQLAANHVHFDVQNHTADSTAWLKKTIFNTIPAIDVIKCRATSE